MPFCTECGTKLKVGQRFCSECGTKAAGTGAVRAAAPAPAPAPPSATGSKYTGAGMALPSYRGTGTTRVAPPKGPEKKTWQAPKPVSKRISDQGGASTLTAHEQWVIYNGKSLRLSARGYGIPSLKSALPMAGVAFVVFRISAENVGNTGKGIITDANIILQWKGPQAKTMDKVKLNGNLQTALDRFKPNKGFIEVLGTRNLSTANIYDRWRPGSGSKVIQD